MLIYICLFVISWNVPTSVWGWYDSFTALCEGVFCYLSVSKKKYIVLFERLFIADLP